MNEDVLCLKRQAWNCRRSKHCFVLLHNSREDRSCSTSKVTLAPVWDVLTKGFFKGRFSRKRIFALNPVEGTN